MDWLICIKLSTICQDGSILNTDYTLYIRSTAGIRPRAIAFCCICVANCWCHFSHEIIIIIILRQFIRRCFHLHSLQWEVLMMRRLFKFYWCHGDPSAKHLVWLAVSHLLHRHYHCIKHYYSRQIACTNLPIPKRWIAWLARAHVYVLNLLRVIIRLNPVARAGIEPRSMGTRPHSMPMNQPHNTWNAVSSICWQNTIQCCS